MSSVIYLDYAAATPVDERVIEAMRPFWADNFYNPSASYLAAKAARDALEQARADVASQLGTRPSEIIFTAGATEALNLAIHGVMRQYPGANVIASATEHDAVLSPISAYDRKLAPVARDGRIDLAKLGKLIDDKTALVAVMLANNEIGTIEPIKEVAKLIADERASRRASNNNLPIYLLTDAAQAANYLDLHVSRLGVDTLVINGGKIYGPKQSGALFVKTGVKLAPLIAGGGQEGGLRSGTENVAFAVGLAKALIITGELRASEAARLSELQSYFLKQLAANFPDAKVNGSLKHRLPNNLHFTIPGQDNERLIFALDEKGIMVAAGSACSASDETSSHVLLALGLTDAEARASLRLTMGRATIKTELDRTLSVLARLVA